MKRRLIALVTLLALAATGSALAANRPAKVNLARSSVGKILVNGSGRTLYMFTRDGRNKDKCAGACAAIWPPLTTHGKPAAGSGLNSRLLGTITIAHGAKQVTYAGHPLYTYTGDVQPHETDYVGQNQFGGNWYAVSSSGRAVK